MSDYNETLVDLNQIIQQNPANRKALAHRGETYRRLEHYEQALMDFNRALALKPDYAWALAHCGETYYLLKRYEEALTNFSRAIELKPDYAWALAHRGATYRRLKRTQEALVDFNRAIELNPDDAWSGLHRAQIYVSQKWYEAALADVDRAIALDKSVLSYWQGERGLLLNYLGRYAETIECCRQAVQEAPDDYIALYSLATATALSKGLTAAGADIDRARVASLAALDTPERGLASYRLGGLAALEGKVEEALDYLHKAIPLDDDPLELARHDPVWRDLYSDPHFQALLTENSAQLR